MGPTYCGWCGTEVNPSMRTGWDRTPQVGAFKFHFSCAESMSFAFDNLARNLRDAAALCAAFWQGHEQREHEQLYSNHGYRTDQDWAPGCGRPVKGGE
jgi:hypothetical protein